MDSAMKLQGAKEYLSGISRRPLWTGERQPEDSVCYSAIYKNEASFNTALSDDYKAWCAKKSPDTIFQRGRRNHYPKEFLNYFAETRLNIPNPPDGYDLVTKFNDRGIIQNRIPQPAESLAEKLGPIGIKVLDGGAYPRTAFPVDFLEILQGVIKSDPSLKGMDLIDEALSKYRSSKPKHFNGFV